MRSLALALTAALVMLPSVATHAADDTKTVVVQANASVGSRTSLTVSSQQLEFVLTDSKQPAVATIEFVAGARTHAGAEVVLTVEAVRSLEGPGGAADVDAAITFSAEGEGAIAGTMSPATPVIAGRWTGSGRRTGRLSFALRAGVPGTYTMPLRFILSAP
jgi:hypothetical protein